MKTRITDEIASRYDCSSDKHIEQVGREYEAHYAQRDEWWPNDWNQMSRLVRNRFSDGSTFVIGSDWWDVGYQTCFCSVTLGHSSCQDELDTSEVNINWADRDGNGGPDL